MKKIDLKGQKFTRLKVIQEDGKDGHGQYKWLCQCDCGNIVSVTGGHLRNGHTQSCGCLRMEKTKEHRKTHGKRHTRLYKIWAGIKTRCLNENVPEFKWYGGRGIAVCEEWSDDFQTFYDWAMANGYRDDLTIDRIDTNGNYEPSNCRWATMKEQQNNRRSNHLITHNDATHTIMEWAEIYSVEYFNFYEELRRTNFNIAQWEISHYLKKLKEYSGYLTRQQVRVLKGQIIAGEPAAAMKGLWRLLQKEERC